MEAEKTRKTGSFGKKFGRIFQGAGGALVAFIVMFVIMCFASQYFLGINNLTNLMRQIVTNGLLAYGLTLCLIIGQIDLSVGSLIGMGGVLLVRLMQLGVSFGLALVLTLVAGLIIGLISGVIVAYTSVPAFIATLAMMNIIRGADYLISGGTNINVNNDAFAAYAGNSVGPIPNTVVYLIIVTIIVALLLHRTVFGRHCYATGGNKETAVFSGINVKKITIVVYLISAFLAVFAGTLSASRVYQGQPTAGEGAETDAIAAAVIGGTSFTGGRGTIIGSLFGALVLGLINNGFNLLGINYYLQLVFKGVLIIVAVLIDTKNKKA